MRRVITINQVCVKWEVNERDREKERTGLGRFSFGKDRGRKEVVGSGRVISSN